MRYIHTMEYYSAIKETESPTHATTWMPYMKKVSTESHILYYSICKISKTGKSTQTENRLAVARARRPG